MRRCLAGFLIVAGSLLAGVAFAERKLESDDKKPISEQKKSVSDDKKPVVDQKKPVVDQKKASADAKKPDEKPAVTEPSAPAASSPESAELDPKRGRGARNVGEEAEPPKAKPEAAAPATRDTKPKPSAAARPDKGKRTTSPKSTTRSTPDRAQRRQIAAGATAEDLTSAKDDSELRSMRDAELVLFPQPLPGLVPGWSWDLPEARDSLFPELVTGAPPAARLSLPSRPSPAAADWVRQLVLPNLPSRLEERVLKYLAFYRDTPSGRGIARVWAKKSGRFAPALRAELAKAGLPTDLVWLSLVESAHNPNIVSPAGAAGLWQFMPDAGRTYGLTIDRWVDERFDPERATEAACRYLSDLYRRFGTWELAMAAYNMGHGGLGKAIRKYNSNDFWELSRYEAGLPWETTLYVPKILATALMMTNRRAFGIDEVELEPSERFETVLVGSGVLLEDVARLASVPLATVEALNPQYLAGRTPPSSAAAQNWPVRVPPGLVGRVREALSREALNDERFAAYVVRAGDTVESIAQIRGATEAQIRALNRVDPKEVLSAGTVLLVPRTERTREDEPSETVAVVPPRTFDYPERKRVFYRVVAGETLTSVGNLFGVSHDEIVEWNALDKQARLTAGLSLQLFVAKSRDLSRVRYLATERAKILVAGSPDFFDYFEAQNGRRRFVVRARNADTLALIGKRYGSTVASMERINRRSRTDPIAIGEPVVVYTDRAEPAPGDELYATSRERSAEDTLSRQ